MKKLSLLLACAVTAASAYAVNPAQKANPMHAEHQHAIEKMKQADKALKSKTERQRILDATKAEMESRKTQAHQKSQSQIQQEAKAEAAKASFEAAKAKVLDTHAKLEAKEAQLKKMRAQQEHEEMILCDSTIGHWANGNLYSKDITKYDEQGRWIEETFDLYDEDGNLSDNRYRYYNDYTDNSRTYTSYVWNPVTNDWECRSKSEAQWNDNNYNTYQAYWSWDYEKNELVQTDKYITEYDDYNNATLNESWYWDREKGEWRGSSKRVNSYEYDEEGNIISRKNFYYNWDYDKWDWKGSDGYGEINLPDHYQWTIYYWSNELNDFYLQNQSNYYYDSLGRTICSEFYEGDSTTGKIFGSSKEEIEFAGDTQDYASKKQYSWADDANDWYLASLENYEYVNGRQSLYERYYCPAYGEELVGDYKYEYTYDPETYSQLSEKSYYWDYANNEWHISNMSECTYDQYGYQDSYVSYYWDADANVLVGSYKWFCVHDENGWNLLWENYNWSSETNDWYITSKDERAYDEAYRQTLSSSYYFDHGLGKLVGSYKYEYGYDENGYQILDRNYTWNSETDAWVLTRESNREYTTDNYVLYALDTYYSFDSEDYESHSYNYTYNDEMDVINEEGKDIYFRNGEKEEYEWTRLYVYEDEKVDGIRTKTQTSYFNNLDNPSSKEVKVYDVNGYLASETWYYIDGTYDEATGEYTTYWKPYYLYLYEHDAEGRELMRVYAYYEDALGDWYYNTKNIHEYDANGNLTLEATASCDNYGTREWTITYKTEYTYNESGLQTLYASYYWDYGREEFYGSWKIVYNYDDQNQLLEYAAYTWDWERWDWKGENRNVHEYDTYGNETLSASYYWSTDHNDWYGDRKYEYAFDENGYRTLDSSYYWDWDRWDWYGSYKYEYGFTPSGYRCMNASYYWDNNTAAWVGSYKSEDWYDDNEQYLGYVGYEWSDGKWVGTYGTKYIYTENSRTSEYIRWDYDKDDWYTDSAEEYSFDENGRTIKMKHYSYNPETEELEFIYVIDYYYSDHADGIVDIFNESGVNTIYRIDGVKVSGDKQSLTPGFYIINGKKVLVK